MVFAATKKQRLTFLVSKERFLLVGLSGASGSQHFWCDMWSVNIGRWQKRCLLCRFANANNWLVYERALIEKAWTFPLASTFCRGIPWGSEREMTDSWMFLLDLTTMTSVMKMAPWQILVSPSRWRLHGSFAAQMKGTIQGHLFRTKQAWMIHSRYFKIIFDHLC